MVFGFANTKRPSSKIYIETRIDTFKGILRISFKRLNLHFQIFCHLCVTI